MRCVFLPSPDRCRSPFAAHPFFPVFPPALYSFFLLCCCAAQVALAIAVALTVLLSRRAAPPPVASVAVSLSTPSTALTPALALALRCDAALALAPLGIPLFAILLVNATASSGTVLQIGATDPANTNTSCAGGGGAQLRRALAAPACAAPLPQALGGVTLLISSTVGDTAVTAAFANMSFPGARSGAAENAAAAAALCGRSL